MKAFFQKYQTLLETMLLLMILAGGCVWKYEEWKLQQTQHEIAGKILRFHVRANSNSPADQALKLKVRDAVGAMMQQDLAGVQDRIQCENIVKKQMPRIIKTAEEVIAQEGYTYPVSAQIGTAAFPQKTYGNYTFPAGDYQALHIVCLLYTSPSPRDCS